MLMVIDTMIAIPTPCARATPSGPMLFAPRVDPALTSATTLPAPRNTKSSVPTNSAVSGRRSLDMAGGPRVVGDGNLGRGLGAPQIPGAHNPGQPKAGPKRAPTPRTP